MREWLGGTLLLAVGVLVVLFRSKFRYDGPAGVTPLSDGAPTSKAEQVIVTAFGIALLLIGMYLLIQALAGTLGY